MLKRSSKSREAAAAYRSLIDAAVDQTRGADLSDWVEKKRMYSKAPAHRRFNSFIRSLSAEQRTLLADLLREERRSTIHDLLANWTWWIACKGLGFTLGRKPVPVDVSDMGLHGDFIGRLQDWEWPDEPAD
jgi:hypothetical protein